jgi:hypothetical protein
MRLIVTTLGFAALLLLAIFELLRRRKLREKYAALWMVTGILIIVLAAVPALLDRLAGVLGIASGVSLVLFLGIVFLLMVCMHLSLEVSQLEEETRTLAEEIALLRMDVRRSLESPSFADERGRAARQDGS